MTHSQQNSQSFDNINQNTAVTQLLQVRSNTVKIWFKRSQLCKRAGVVEK